MQKVQILISFGKLFEKGLLFATGQADVRRYNRYLRDLIIAGKGKPSFIVSHEVSIEETPDAYGQFDKRIDGYTKVLIHPNGEFCMGKKRRMELSASKSMMREAPSFLGFSCRAIRQHSTTTTCKNSRKT
ncbi:hypothetical protein GJ744_009069 [Endocarpon pusillum]|uniref:Uncharacterized protein n=1 Tax=Endocarpon pusillum TaxID=364733 RepID=A0A8H7E446_9EURO|nr:hypothetical protein GJ744_009069 [Endocarpon pusillum]